MKSKYLQKIICFILSLSILTSCVTLDVNPIPNSTSLMMARDMLLMMGVELIDGDVDE